MAVQQLGSIFSLAAAYILLSVGCELRTYKGGHRYIKAFYARTPYQQFFTLMQSPKDIAHRDIGRLTYLGYTGVVLSTAAGIVGIVLSLWRVTQGSFAFTGEALGIWAGASGGWGIMAALLQGADSLLNPRC